MRNVMRQCLMVSALLINTMSVFASLQYYDRQDGFVVIEHRCQQPVNPDYSSDIESNGVSQQGSVLGTPVLKPHDYMSCQREDSLASSDFALSDCGTKAPSDCGTKAPSDCGTRISDSDPLAKSLNAILVMKSVTSRGSLNEFFDEHGNPKFFEPSTPLTARGEGSPKKPSSRKIFLPESHSPRRV